MRSAGLSIPGRDTDWVIIFLCIAYSVLNDYSLTVHCFTHLSLVTTAKCPNVSTKVGAHIAQTRWAPLITASPQVLLLSPPLSTSRHWSSRAQCIRWPRVWRTSARPPLPRCVLRQPRLWRGREQSGSAGTGPPGSISGICAHCSGSTSNAIMLGFNPRHKNFYLLLQDILLVIIEQTLLINVCLL